MSILHLPLPTSIGWAQAQAWRTADGCLLRLPIPPSSNEYWTLGRSGRSGKGHHIMRSHQATVYIRATEVLIASQLKAHELPLFPEGDVILDVSWNRRYKRGDLLNYTAKVLPDALQGLAYSNDSQISRSQSQRNEVDGPGWVDVTVRPA